MARLRRTTTTHETVRIGEAEIAYTVVRSSRRTRTIALHVDAGTVRVLAPVRTTKAEVESLLARRAHWIATRLAAPPNTSVPSLLAPGATLPYRGAALALSIEHGPVPTPRVEAIVGGLHVVLPVSLAETDIEVKLRIALIAWYRTQAESLVRDAIDRWTVTMDAAPKAVFVRDQKRRWGSCSPDGTLRFNWRLAMFPPSILEYVVVHELAHLRHKNHAPAFWAEVARWLPDYKAARASLRAAPALPL